MPRLWFYRPTWYWHRWSLVWIGSDEWWRRTLVIGWPFTGCIIIAISKPQALGEDAE